jgi:spore germination cell wall hydrolase CwlJ-like protein
MRRTRAEEFLAVRAAPHRRHGTTHLKVLAYSVIRRQNMTLGWLLWFTAFLPQPLADQTCLATTVYLEARGEPTAGQFAVAEVALRRRERGHWGNDMCKVVTAPFQFAPSTTSKTFEIRNLAAWNKAWAIAGESMQMWALPKNMRVMVVPKADHFVKLEDASPRWAHATPLRTIGDHTFYALN